MQKSLVNDYLRRCGMEAAQAEALSLILSQTPTREDLGLLRAEMNGRFAQIEERLAAVQLQLVTRLAGLEERIDHKMDRKLTELESRLSRRIIGAMAAMTAIFSAVPVLAG